MYLLSSGGVSIVESTPCLCRVRALFFIEYNLSSRRQSLSTPSVDAFRTGPLLVGEFLVGVTYSCFIDLSTQV